MNVTERAMKLVIGSCEQTQDRLSDRLDGELRGLRRLRMAAHLAYCHRCRAVFRSLSRVVERVHLLGRGDFAPPPAPSGSDRIVERIRRERR
jgi:predicted anti-sigma-YlaC factor YlaD